MHSLLEFDFCCSLLAIPSGSYRAQKPPKARNTKKLRENHKIPHPGLIPKNTKKSNMAPSWPFCIFSVTFSYFRGPTQGGGFCIFFVIFRISGLGGFLCPVRARRNHNSLPFVRIYSGYNSKIIFLCICICYEMKIMSKTISICYAAPPRSSKKNSCFCICNEK